MNGKSVNSEASAATDLIVPWNNWAATLDLNGKTGKDFSTPDATIENSYLKNTNNTAGLSYVGNKIYIRRIFSTYISDYGIPPDPNGGHPNGVDIEMRKYQADIRGSEFLTIRFSKLLRRDTHL